MNPAGLLVNDRVLAEVDGLQFWGYIAAIDGDTVTLDCLRRRPTPDRAASRRSLPDRVAAADIRAVLWNGRPPKGHVGMWIGYPRKIETEAL